MLNLTDLWTEKKKLEENINQATESPVITVIVVTCCGASDMGGGGGVHARCSRSVINTTDKAVTNDRLRMPGL